MNLVGFQTLKVSIDGDVGYIQMYRPEANNALNERMVDELTEVLAAYENEVKVVVLEGLPEVFCFGADFKEIQQKLDSGNDNPVDDPGKLYDLWLKLATGPFVSVAHVRGKVNAAGVGFVAACDVVIADYTAIFSLSELLFGLMPACVLPFLIRRMGYPKANHLTVMTLPIGPKQALDWGLVDSLAEDSTQLLRKQLLRLRLLSAKGVHRYKGYLNELDDSLISGKAKAVAANQLVFSDKENLDKIRRYVRTGKFPWEQD